MPTNDAGPPEGEVPTQDPIEEIAHTAMDAGEGDATPSADSEPARVNV